MQQPTELKPANRNLKHLGLTAYQTTKAATRAPDKADRDTNGVSFNGLIYKYHLCVLCGVVAIVFQPLHPRNIRNIAEYVSIIQAALEL